MEILDTSQSKAKAWNCSLSSFVFLLVFFCLFSAQFNTSAFAVENRPFIGPHLKMPKKGTRLMFSADQVLFNPNLDEATALGNVEMTFGPYRLSAGQVSLNRKTGAFSANGEIKLTEPNGNIVQAGSILIRNKFRDAFLAEVSVMLTNRARLKAKSIKLQDGSIVLYQSASYTACGCITRRGNPVWELVSDETEHDLNKRNLYHTNPKLKIDGVTVAALPYLAMPDFTVTRRSGFLTPDFAVGDAVGFGLITPYFLNLSPSTDLTFRPVWTTKQGPVADIEWRQALENGSYNIRGFGVHQITPLAAPNDATWRGAIDTHGFFYASADWTFGWNGTIASDRTFLSSYSYDGREYATNDLFLRGLWDQTFISAQVYNFQSLSSAQNPAHLPVAMPYLMGDTIFRDLPSVGGQAQLTWNAYALHRDQPFTPFVGVNQGTDQLHASAKGNWHRQIFSDAGIVATPFVNLRADFFATQNVPGSGSASTLTSARLLPEAGLDLRWPFVATHEHGQSVITPIMQVIVARDEGSTSDFGNENAVTLDFDRSSLFLGDRFSGTDRYEGGTRADLGISYAYYGKEGGAIHATLGQSYHMAGQNSFSPGSGFDGFASDIIGAIDYQPVDYLSVSYEARAKSDFSAFSRHRASAGLSFDDFSADLSYLNFASAPTFGRNTAEHWLAANSKLAIGDGWSVFGGMTYDFTTSVVTRKSAGIEFDCECMNFKITYTGTQDSITLAQDNQIRLSVDFATLGKTSFAAAF